MTPLFLQYPKCGTCRKASKWLEENNVTVENRHIVEHRPTKEELTAWIEKSGLPVQKFFNTSGQVYKQNNLKDIVKIAPKEELIAMLAENGMLVKRPLLITDTHVLVGFKEEEWTKALKS